MAQYSSTSPAPTNLRRPEPPPQKSGTNVRRVALIAVGVLIGVFVLLFVLAVLLAQVSGREMPETVDTIRDLVIIFLALEGIMIILALSVLIFQVARLVNLLQTEVKPVLQDTRATMQNARGTVSFVADTISEPLIKASAFFAGVGALVSNVGGIRTALKKTAQDAKEVADA